MSLLTPGQSTATYQFAGLSTPDILRNAARLLEELNTAEYVSSISFDTNVTHMNIGGNVARYSGRQVLTVEVTG
jgi:hypothetical protein